MMSDHITGGPAELFSKEVANGDLIVLQTEKRVPWKAYCMTRPETMYTPTVKRFLELLNQYAD